MSIFYDPDDFISELPPFGKPLMSRLLPEEIEQQLKELEDEKIMDSPDYRNLIEVVVDIEKLLKSQNELLNKIYQVLWNKE